MNPSSKQLIQQVLAYLSIRDRSNKEIREYLEKKTTDPHLIDEITQYLDNHNLVNDANFGSQWAESRVRRRKGDIQITRELIQKGLPKELVLEILDSITLSDWLAAMGSLIDKKATKYAQLNPYQKKSKIYQLLTQHGFSTKLIDAFLKANVE